MKLAHCALILIATFCTHPIEAQTTVDPPRLSLGGSKGYLFSLNGIPYETQISAEAIASSPDWQVEDSPPVGIAAATKTARRQLKELLEDEASWQVDEISLSRVTSAPSKGYYTIHFIKSIDGASRKSIQLLVDFSGNSGKVWVEKSIVTIWQHTSYDDARTAMRLCDGLETGAVNASGIVWAFKDYDAVIAVGAENGKVSRMTYWTRKDFENSDATPAASGQSIQGVTFYTSEKKVSVKTIKK